MVGGGIRRREQGWTKTQQPERTATTTAGTAKATAMTTVGKMLLRPQRLRTVRNMAAHTPVTETPKTTTRTASRARVRARAQTRTRTRPGQSHGHDHSAEDAPATPAAPLGQGHGRAHTGHGNVQNHSHGQGAGTATATATANTARTITTAATTGAVFKRPSLGCTIYKCSRFLEMIF